jgi:hypothetical protein
MYVFAAYLEDGLMVTSLSKLRNHYFSSSSFFYDILSLFPLESIISPKSSSWEECPFNRLPCPVIYRLPRLFRMHRLMEYLSKTEGRTNYPNAFQIIQLVFYIAVFIHWNACLYFGMSYYIGFGKDHWVFPNITAAHPDTSRLLYQYSYW